MTLLVPEIDSIRCGAASPARPSHRKRIGSGLLDELISQEADARRQVTDALTALADGCGELDKAARSFAEAFQVAMDVR